jgi:hypothetical protein
MNALVVSGNGLEEGTAVKEMTYLNTVLDARLISGMLDIHKNELKDIGLRLGSGMNANARFSGCRCSSGTSMLARITFII